MTKIAIPVATLVMLTIIVALGFGQAHHFRRNIAGVKCAPKHGHAPARLCHVAAPQYLIYPPEQLLQSGKKRDHHQLCKTGDRP